MQQCLFISRRGKEIQYGAKNTQLTLRLCFFFSLREIILGKTPLFTIDFFLTFAQTQGNKIKHKEYISTLRLCFFFSLHEISKKHLNWFVQTLHLLRAHYLKVRVKIRQG